MGARRSLRQLLGQGARQARRGARALEPAGRLLAERLAYRPREVVVVALLAGGLFGGLAVERWRARHSTTADRLEAEPPRLTSRAEAPLAPRARPRAAALRCDPRSGRRTDDPGFSRFGQPRLDLNRATPHELARLAGISWGLAARIVAARETFEGRDAGVGREPPGRERVTGFRRRPPPRPAGLELEAVAPEADGPAPPTSPPLIDAPSAPDPPEPGSGEEAPEPPPQ